VNKQLSNLPLNYRWNFVVFLVDIICFGVAFTFASVSSVIPSFVGQLTDSPPLIGMADVVFRGSWLLPQLITSRFIIDKPRKKPYMIGGLIGRVTFWATASALWAGLDRYPTAMLTLFFVNLGIFAACDGFTSVAWFDILSRTIPVRRRGRLMGTSQFISGLLGAGVGVLVGQILERQPFPHNYALLFTLAGLVLLPSAIALILVREPALESVALETDEPKKSSWLEPFADSNFRRLMASRLLVGMISMCTSFYVVHAEEALHLPESVVGAFVTAETLARVGASVVLGVVSERWGSRYAARIGSAVAFFGPLLALAADLTGGGWFVWAYPLVYVALGVINSTWMLGFLNYLLEIAPEGKNPAYTGLGNTTMGILTLTPLVGGWLLQTTSYVMLFGVTAALVAAGFLFTLRLKPVGVE
jgi:MFS family permease